MAASVPLDEVKQGTTKTGAEHAHKKCIVISYSTKQREFKDVVQKKVESYGFEAWSGADVYAGANWLNQWLQKMKHPNTVAVVFILSKSFAQSPACQKEIQYVTQNLEGYLGIMPIMYEEFPMPDELIFLLTTVNYVTAEPVVQTKCTCKKTCECSDALLRREQEVSDEWFRTKFRPGLMAALRGYVPDEELSLRRESITTSASPVSSKSVKQLHEDMVDQMLNRVVNTKSSDSQDGAAQEEATETEPRKKIAWTKRGIKITRSQTKAKIVSFVVIHGSTGFHDIHTEQICKEIGKQLAMCKQRVVLVSGGFVGVADTTCRSFCMKRRELGKPEDTFMILPETDPDIEGQLHDKAPIRKDLDGTTKFAEWDFGQTLFYGRSSAERLEIMGKLGTCILVEGGPTAAKAAQLEQKAGFVVIPVRCTGGFAANTALFKDSPFEPDLYKSAPLAGEEDRHGSQRLSERELLESAQRSWDLLQAGTVKDPAKVAAAVVGVVSAYHELAGGRDEAKQLPDIPQSSDNRPGGLQVLQDFSSFCSYLRKFKAVVLFNGHGSAGQYGNLQEVDEIVDLVVYDLDARFGKEGWLVLYGGEPYEEAVHTISYPVRRLHTEHGKPVCAVQCTEYGAYVQRPCRKIQYAHLTGGALYEYPTKRHFDRRSRKENIQFGGYDQHGNLIGGSAVWYHEEVLALGYPTCHVLIGGGPIASDDADISLKKNIPIFYARTKKKIQNPLVVRQNPADAYGQMEHWANEHGIPRDQWHPFAWSCKLDE